MPKIQFGASAYVEEAYGLPNSLLENWYVEPADDRGDWGYRLVPTPGLTAFSTGGNEGRGTWQSDSIANGKIFVVYDTLIYSISSVGGETAISGGAGAVTNDNKPVASALTQTEAVVCSGGDVYKVTATVITDFTANLVSAGASGDIIDVAAIDSTHLYAEGGSGRVFYSDPGDCQTIAGFFTAERSPDQVKGLLVVGSSILVFGKKSTELWTSTGSTTTPFIRRQGFTLEQGLIGQRARAQLDGAGYWVANDNTVRVWRGGLAQVISGGWLSRQIASLSDANRELVRVTAHNWLGANFVKVYLPGKGSYFYDATSGAWHRRKDIGDEVTDWGYDYFVEAFGGTYCQELSTGRLFKLDHNVFVENSATVRRVATALAPITGAERISTLTIEGQGGVGLDGTTAQGSDPECMLRIAYDGRVFGDEMVRKIGKAGEYRWRPVFGPLGTVREPVVRLELAYSDPVGWSVYGASVNGRAY